MHTQKIPPKLINRVNWPPVLVNNYGGRSNTGPGYDEEDSETGGARDGDSVRPRRQPQSVYRSLPSPPFKLIISYKFISIFFHIF